jgi:hypothetical protein
MKHVDGPSVVVTVGLSSFCACPCLVSSGGKLKGLPLRKTAGPFHFMQD